jgi:tetratricopeptide (TPR) repeat protein
VSREERLARGRIEYAKALQHDPNDLTARLALIRATSTAERRTKQARELAALHPESARAWLALASELAAGEERKEVVARAASLGADNASVLNSVAWTYVREQRREEALSLALRAVELQPWSPAYVDTLAAALAINGRCAEALAAQRRALVGLGERAAKEVLEDFSLRLAIYERGCLEPPVKEGGRESTPTAGRAKDTAH